MRLDADALSVTVVRGSSSLTVHLASEQGFDCSQTNRFEPPYNEGNPPEFQQDMPDHWHFTAATREPAGVARILAVMLVRDEFEKIDVRWTPTGIEIETPDGAGEARAELISRSRLYARWTPARGDGEEFSRML
jgi:hypothetical protein